MFNLTSFGKLDLYHGSAFVFVDSYHPYHLPPTEHKSEPRSLASLTDMMAMASKMPKAFTENEEDGGGKRKLDKFDNKELAAASGGGLDTMLCKRVVTKDRRYITQITCFEKGQQHTFGAKAVGPAEKRKSGGGRRKNVPATNGMPAPGAERNALRLPVFGKQQGGGALASLFSLNRQLGRWSMVVARKEGRMEGGALGDGFCLHCDAADCVACSENTAHTRHNTNTAASIPAHTPNITETSHKQSLLLSSHLAFRLLHSLFRLPHHNHNHRVPSVPVPLLLPNRFPLRFQLDSLQVLEERKQGT